MECTLATLIACFSWSGLYLDNQVSVTDREVPYHYWKYTGTTAKDGVIETSYLSTIGNESQNPYLRNAIGFQLSFRKIDVSVEAFHDSSMSSNEDRGVNGLALKARWYPFRQ
jgi:DNA/RNA endonuclease G (NUC1)